MISRTDGVPGVDDDNDNDNDNDHDTLKQGLQQVLANLAPWTSVGSHDPSQKKSLANCQVLLNCRVVHVAYRARENAFQINSWEPENRIRIMELIEKG